MAGKSAPARWVSHYPKMLWAYRKRGEDGLQEIEERLRSEAAAQPGGKFGKLQAAYVPTVPLPPLDWRHQCGHCRFWVDHGPGEPGECMVVGREDDPMGGKSIHEKAGCALFMPPAGEPAFSWLGEQLDPTGADVVRGEFHPRDAADEAQGSTRRPTKRAGGPWAPAGRLVDVEPVITGLAAPIAIEFHPTRAIRYVADQQGLVYVHDADRVGAQVDSTAPREEPLLDLRAFIVDLQAQYDERGILGIALHPEFPDDPRIFVRYSAPVGDGTPSEYDHTEVLSAFEVGEDGLRADRATEETILEIPSPQFNHNAGAVAFGPDGYCYVAMGDGGGEGDQGPGHVEGGNAQDVTENVLGSILRIDVDETEGGDETRGDDDSSIGPNGAYSMPEDNPFVGKDGIDELYAWGLRNPWRLSFDAIGRLFVADVGQALYEEINVVERGGNYGWPIREGFHCFDAEHPSDPPTDCAEVSRRGEQLRDPILEYPHLHGDAVVGSAIIGGCLYEGQEIPALEGSYVFGDWATTQDRPSGRLFAAEPAAGTDEPWSMEELVVASTEGGRLERNVLGFGRDPDGELYVLANETHVPSGDTGVVLRVTRGDR